jgi:hypothetical protein
VLRRVGQRLRDHVVGRYLHRIGQPPLGADVELDRDRGAARERAQGGTLADAEADADLAASSAAAEQALRGEINTLQRRTLRELLDRGRIGVTTLRTLQRELDFQEAAIASTQIPSRQDAVRASA